MDPQNPRSPRGPQIDFLKARDDDGLGEVGGICDALIVIEEAQIVGRKVWGDIGLSVVAVFQDDAATPRVSFGSKLQDATGERRTQGRRSRS